MAEDVHHHPRRNILCQQQGCARVSQVVKSAVRHTNSSGRSTGYARASLPLDASLASGGSWHSRARRLAQEPAESLVTPHWSRSCKRVGARDRTLQIEPAMGPSRVVVVEPMGCKYPVTGLPRIEPLVGYHAGRTWSSRASTAACASLLASSCSGCMAIATRA